jgi:hypothetical protein
MAIVNRTISANEERGAPAPGAQRLGRQGGGQQQPPRSGDQDREILSGELDRDVENPPFGGAGSTRKAVFGPTSPPSANPCNIRNKTAATGAAIPIIAYDGVTARPASAMPIMENVSIIAGFRPLRSAKCPITKPPSGRVTKPTPKVASESSSLASPLPGNRASQM